MRAILWLVLMVGLFPNVQLIFGQLPAANSEAESLVLRGKVMRLTDEALPKTSVVIVTATLTLEFVNMKKSPVILLIQRSPLCTGTTLTKNDGPALADNILFDEYRGPSVSTSPDWKVFHMSLDQPRPPVGLVQIIKPGESWSTENFVVLHPPIKLERYRVDRSPASWQMLKDFSPLWLRLRCDVWPLNIERQPTSGKMAFGHELQQRWQNVGELQLNSLVSEPIEMDLREREHIDAPK